MQLIKLVHRDFNVPAYLVLTEVERPTDRFKHLAAETVFYRTTQLNQDIGGYDMSTECTGRYVTGLGGKLVWDGNPHAPVMTPRLVPIEIVNLLVAHVTKSAK